MMDLVTIMALVRGVHLAAMLSLLGAVGFIAWMLPPAAAQPASLRCRLTTLCWVSGMLALLSGVTWFALQAGAIADADSVSDWLDALPVVAAHTHFGNILMLRCGLLLAATALAWWLRRAAVRPAATPSLLWPREPTPGGGLPRVNRDRKPPTGRRSLPLYLALGLTVIALALQGFIGHAGAAAGATGDGLMLSEACHLLAAGVWLGALLPLWLSVRALSPPQAGLVCERFSPIGLASVLVLVGSGFAQALQLIGSFPALFGTAYGHLALLKIALFLLALLLAAVNRLGLTDRLAADVAMARRQMMLAVGLETLVGLAIVFAAAFMASTPPAAHSTPVWPFSWRLSLTTVNEDADFRREVVIGLVAIGAAIALLLVALLWRRFRLVALAILVLSFALRGPSFELLTVEAYPTSFQTSPTGFSAGSIVRGEALYGPNCALCHGPKGEGNGPVAATLRIKPADLTLPHVREHTDGEMFWWLTHGIDDPEGGRAMPGFATSVSAEDRWALIDYVRAANAGLAMQRDPASNAAIAAPAFPVRCNSVAASSTADLHGHVLHVAAGEATLEVPPESGITTITLDLNDGASPVPGACAAADPAAWGAYAILADRPADRLAGADFLVDPNGWLRAVRRPDAPGGRPLPDDLITAIRGIIAHPVEQPSGGQHVHSH